jgi:hypothetical protein
MTRVSVWNALTKDNAASTFMGLSISNVLCFYASYRR